MLVEETQAEGEANAAAQHQGTTDTEREENGSAVEQANLRAQKEADDICCKESAKGERLVSPQATSSNSALEDEFVALKEPLDISPGVARLVAQPDETNLVFQRATSSQITQHFWNNSLMFSGPLPTSLYMQMQRRLYLEGNEKENAAHWVVFYRDKPDKILCSCTTYRRDAIINQGMGMEPVSAVMITDIFTLPEYRRQGLATGLLKSLQRTLDRGTTKKVTFSIIYSHSNTDFYDRLGWKPQPATHLRITLGKSTVELPPQSEKISYASLWSTTRAARLDVNMSKCRLSAMREKGKVYAQVLPARTLLQYHRLRALMTKEFMTGSQDRTKSWLGAHYRETLTSPQLGA